MLGIFNCYNVTDLIFCTFCQINCIHYIDMQLICSTGKLVIKHLNPQHYIVVTNFERTFSSTAESLCIEKQAFVITFDVSNARFFTFTLKTRSKAS